MAKLTNVVVSRVMSRKFDNKTLYSFFIDNVDGLFRHGEVPLPFDRGARITFEYNETSKGINVLPNTVVVHDQESASKTVTVSKNANAPAYSTGEKDMKISYMSARNAAIEVTKLVVENGMLSLGTKKADQVDNLLAFVDETTMRFFMDLDTISERVAEVKETNSILAKESAPNDQGDWNDD